jgi:hypothetical protein
VEEGVLSEGSHSSAGYGSMALRSAVLHVLSSLPFYSHGKRLQLFR